MANNAAAVRVGTTGSISVAPLATALPSGSQTTLNVAFAPLGYMSAAGVIESIGTESNKITAWQNGDVVREVQTSSEVTYKFECLETNPTVLKTYYGNYAAGKVEVNGLVLPHQEWVIDAIDGLDVVRIVIPFGQVTERGDIAWVNGDVAMYAMTVEAFPDPAYSGSLAGSAKAYKYLYDVSDGVSA